MNDLVVTNNSIVFSDKHGGKLITEQDIEWIERLRDVSYKEFPFTDWGNKYVKLYIRGSFPVRVGDTMTYKKSQVILKGFILGYDDKSNVVSFMEKGGNTFVYIPSIDGVLTLYEGRLKNNMLIAKGDTV